MKTRVKPLTAGIAQCPTGIPGLDELTRGGLPQGTAPAQTAGRVSRRARHHHLTPRFGVKSGQCRRRLDPVHPQTRAATGTTRRDCRIIFHRPPSRGGAARLNAPETFAPLSWCVAFAFRFLFRHLELAPVVIAYRSHRNYARLCRVKVEGQLAARSKLNFGQLLPHQERRQ